MLLGQIFDPSPSTPDGHESGNTVHCLRAGTTMATAHQIGTDTGHHRVQPPSMFFVLLSFVGGLLILAALLERG
jgi:hypothetical protein